MSQDTFLPDDNLAATGIAGLDAVLEGGFPRTNVILVQGATGTGKTVFGVEFVYRGIVEFDEPGMIVLFETSPAKLIRDCATFGWDLARLQREGKLEIIFTSPDVLDEELRSPESLLLEKASSMGANRIFIDGINLLSPPAPGTGGRSVEIRSFRRLLQQVIDSFSRARLTAVLSHEIPSFVPTSDTLDSSGFLVDTVVQLNLIKDGRKTSRTIEIVKNRGHKYSYGQHTLHITDGVGLEVFRRVQARVYSEAVQPSSQVKQSVTGVAALDLLTGGGLYEGSTTMVIGVSGVGKTVLGTHLLREGITRGKRGLLVSLDEHPAQIIRNAAAINLDLQTLMNDGSLRVLFDSPQELDIDAHFNKITREVEKHGIERMVIDGMTSYSTAIGDQKVYRDFVHALVGYSKGRLMTAFFNYENPEFLGISSFMPDFPVSSIVDNIILLSMVEIRSAIRRCITVVKARGCKHEFDSREYLIGEGGINLVPIDRKGAMTFSRYTSVLSRAPTRRPARLKTYQRAAELALE
ncbi:ATPase domain-containing protein [Nevskia soli]|uniref:ATPase domain-containing protein n=1 Tax=Nevskia soli TaxID=418856 RepID=UPI0015D8434B|nr:ATPase domain-containing protein [Nevskia soli]